jgi:hypothetical protein
VPGTLSPGARVRLAKIVRGLRHLGCVQPRSDPQLAPTRFVFANLPDDTHIGGFASKLSGALPPNLAIVKTILSDVPNAWREKYVEFRKSRVKLLLYTHQEFRASS